MIFVSGTTDEQNIKYSTLSYYNKNKNNQSTNNCYAIMNIFSKINSEYGHVVFMIEIKI